jgi:signal transduction histidine kinase
MIEELHDKLMKEFRNYFENYTDWISNETHAAGKRTRTNLSEIRHIVLKMRQEILETRRLKPKIKSPAYKAQQLAQKQQAQDDNGTN